MQIRDFLMSDLPALVAVQNAAVPMRAYSHNELENDFLKLELHLRPTFIVALEQDVLVGAANFHRFAGAYHPNKFGAEVFVHPDHQQRGVGAALYDILLGKLQPLEPISLSVYVRESEPHAVAFAQKRGFGEIKRDFESLCAVQEFSSEPYTELFSSLEQEGVRLVGWAEAESMERRQEFHEVFEVVRLDVPRAEPPTRLSFEFFDENVISDPELLWEACFFCFASGQNYRFYWSLQRRTRGLGRPMADGGDSRSAWSRTGNCAQGAPTRGGSKIRFYHCANR